MGYYSIIKKNEIMSFSGECMEVEIIILKMNITYSLSFVEFGPKKRMT
jgi:hypothetical protein